MRKLTLNELLALNLPEGTRVIGYLGVCEYRLFLGRFNGGFRAEYGTYEYARASKAYPWESLGTYGPYHLSIWSRFSLGHNNKIGRFIP